MLAVALEDLWLRLLGQWRQSERPLTDQIGLKISEEEEMPVERQQHCHCHWHCQARLKVKPVEQLDKNAELKMNLLRCCS